MMNDQNQRSLFQVGGAAAILAVLALLATIVAFAMAGVMGGEDTEKLLSLINQKRLVFMVAFVAVASISALVFVVQPTCAPMDEHLMEMLVPQNLGAAAGQGDVAVFHQVGQVRHLEDAVSILAGVEGQALGDEVPEGVAEAPDQPGA